MDKSTIKVDMHVHSKYSGKPHYWVLQKIGCYESYTEPVQIYEIARSKGMDLVTITDHNAIEGNLEIAHLENTFISEEITASFPEDKCDIHVLAYGISESQHENIRRLSENIYELVAYLHQDHIFHALAHPMYAVNDRLSLAHFEQCLLLFDVMELNGSRDNYQSRMLIEILESLSPYRIAQLADKHQIMPYGEKPWQKKLIGGSDDHCGMNIASTYTEFENVEKSSGLMNALRNSTMTVKKSPVSPKTMAHTLCSIAFQYYDKKHQLERYLGEHKILQFFQSTLKLSHPKQQLYFSWVKNAFYNLRRHMKNRFPIMKPAPAIPFHHLIGQLQKLFTDENYYEDTIREDIAETEAKTDIWFDFVQNMSNRSLKLYCDDILENCSNANFPDMFQAMSAAASLYMMIAPYFLSYALFTRDRRFSSKCRDSLCERGQSRQGESRRVAFFTDTFGEINGVAKAIQVQMEMAAKNGTPMTLITCESDIRSGYQKNFEPAGVYQLPEYPELKLCYPPLLKMLDYCYEKNFTHIHSETPGPMGLAALAISRILKIPFNGTYHTSLPQTVRFLTEDTGLEDMTWKYMIWYYGQMDRIYVPSESIAGELIEKGLLSSKIVVFRRGIDIAFFNPGKRNGFYKNHFGLRDKCLKLLYVGRMSKEKNLKLLANAFGKIAALRKDIRLIMVGDGPCLTDIKKELQGLPVLFTGYLEGEDLAQAYASADIFVFPSTTDTLGNVVLEAQASGLPVIVTEKGGPRENMIPGKTGLVFPSEASEVFINHIVKLADNRQLLSLMKENARRFMKDRSCENMFASFWDSYR